MVEPRTHLIWSIDHACWHCRDERGSAAGYTTDIADAGQFETSTALAYNDGRKDRAVPLAEAAEMLRKRMRVLEAQHDGLRETLNTLEVV